MGRSRLIEGMGGVGSRLHLHWRGCRKLFLCGRAGESEGAGQWLRAAAQDTEWQHYFDIARYAQRHRVSSDGSSLWVRLQAVHTVERGRKDSASPVVAFWHSAFSWNSWQLQRGVELYADMGGISPLIDRWMSND